MRGPDGTVPTVGLLAFEVIESCNLYCDFCVRNATHEASRYVSPELLGRRVDAATASFGQISLVALTGGEPMMHPTIHELVQTVKKRGFRTSITTNGTISRQYMLDRGAPHAPDHYIVSLDGHDSETHDAIRGKAGAFSKTVSFIELAVSAGFPTLVNITVGARNSHCVYDTIALSRRLGVVDVSVALIRPEGRGTLADQPGPLLTEVSRQVARARRDFQQQSFQIGFYEPLAHVVDVSLTAQGRRRRCGAASGALHVQCDGTALLCTACHESLGNIDELGSELGDVYRGDRRVQAAYSGIGLSEPCASCTFRLVCGGCRCRAAVEVGGFLGPDPYCPKTRLSANQGEAERVVDLAEQRLHLDRAKQPDHLREWLGRRLNAQNFSRNNLDFKGQFRWGHNWNLGDGQIVQGEMGWRHRDILACWLASGELSRELSGIRILNVGPWTGGEALLLASLGAEVDVVEEVSSYRDVIRHLAWQFDLRIRVIGESLFLLPSTTADHYHFVYASGVISHLTDPIIALRIMYNQLLVGGKCLLETQTSYRADGLDEFWGPSRPGWVWFNLSRWSLLEMLDAVGFEQIDIVDFDDNRRFQLVATKGHVRPMRHQMGASHPVFV